LPSIVMFAPAFWVMVAGLLICRLWKFFAAAPLIEPASAEMPYRELAAHSGVALGSVGKGECLGPGASYTAIAREPSSVIELSAAAFELLPPAMQRTLGRVIMASSAKRFTALAARHAAVAGRSARLASVVKDLPARASRLLALPPLKQALSEIPALPVHAAGLASKLLDDRTHAEDVVESIKNDPALASLVLKRVNSAYYGLETKVSDHYRALLLLGTATVYQLILESAVESVIPDVPESRDVQARATLIAVLAYEVALASGQVPPLLASTIAALRAHTHNVQTRPQQAGAPRTEAPLHPRRLALQLAVSCQSIAQAFELKGAEAQRRWDKIAALLTHAGRDPNWRRRPSVLDQLRGWKRQPLARKKANKRHANHQNLKATA